MKKTSAQIIRITSASSLVLSLTVALLVPLGYFVLAFEYQAAVLSTEVGVEAAQASRIISGNPDYWQFEEHRLEELLSKRRDGQSEIRRVLDLNNALIAESADAVRTPRITRSHDLFDSGSRVARIEISRSLRPLFVRTLLLLIAGLILGIGMLVFLRRIPLRALADALQSFQESESKFRAIASTAADAIMVMDHRGVIAYWNSAAERMFGYEVHETLGKELHTLIAPARYHEAYRNGFQKFRQSGEGPAIGSTLEFSAVRRDGLEFPIEVSTSVITLRGEPHAVGIVRDVTERKRTEQELLKLEKLESLGVLAGGLAHDFNNLLTIIMGNISLAMLDTDPESGNYHRLTKLGEAAVRAQDLTRQLLTFAKGGAPIKKIVSLPELIEESCRFSLSGTNVTCRFSFAEKPMAAEVDANQIGQVLHNLVLNAVQAMPQGGSIEVKCENIPIDPGDSRALDPGRYIRASIRDEGAGIRKEDLPKIFDPYFTTKETGSGLGLATSYSIIKRHGGTITVGSIPGAGSVFSVYLPASHGKPAGREPGWEPSAKGKGKILVMDDEDAYRQVVGEILKVLGYDCELARDGAEAIELYTRAMREGACFDAAIMDLTIPGGMGGKEAMQKLMAIDPHIRAIVASGYSNDPVMADFKVHGFRAVIEKPFDLRTLNSALQTVLGK